MEDLARWIARPEQGGSADLLLRELFAHAFELEARLVAAQRGRWGKRGCLGTLVDVEDDDLRIEATGGLLRELECERRVPREVRSQQNPVDVDHSRPSGATTKPRVWLASSACREIPKPCPFSYLGTRSCSRSHS